MAYKWISRFFLGHLYQPVDQAPLTEEDEKLTVNGLPESSCGITSVTTKPRSGRFDKLSFWILVAILWFGTLGLVYLYSLSVWPKAGPFCDESYHLVKSPIPPVPWITRTFTEDPSMVALKTIEQVEEAWSAYQTTGFIHVDRPEEYFLRPNRDAIPGSINIYMISAHHQLHCLKKLQIAFTILTSQILNATDQEKEMGVKHAEHCWDYLRQGIVCAGDSTLEGPDVEGGTLLGYGVQHQCRQWDGAGGLETYRRLHAVVKHQQ